MAAWAWDVCFLDLGSMLDTEIHMYDKKLILRFFLQDHVTRLLEREGSWLAIQAMGDIKRDCI